jgi:hypothetical protein
MVAMYEGTEWAENPDLTFTEFSDLLSDLCEMTFTTSFSAWCDELEYCYDHYVSSHDL